MTLTFWETVSVVVELSPGPGLDSTDRQVERLCSEGWQPYAVTTVSEGRERVWLRRERPLGWPG